MLSRDIADSVSFSTHGTIEVPFADRVLAAAESMDITAPHLTSRNGARNRWLTILCFMLFQSSSANGDYGGGDFGHMCAVARPILRMDEAIEVLPPCLPAVDGHFCL
jgi:hypothetical protein